MITPSEANTVHEKLACADPCSTINSPTKLLSVGSPMLASVVTRNMMESHGATVATPPKSAIASEWRRS